MNWKFFAILILMQLIIFGLFTLGQMIWTKVDTKPALNQHTGQKLLQYCDTRQLYDTMNWKIPPWNFWKEPAPRTKDHELDSFNRAPGRNPYMLNKMGDMFSDIKMFEAS